MSAKKGRALLVIVACGWLVTHSASAAALPLPVRVDTAALAGPSAQLRST